MEGWDLSRLGRHLFEKSVGLRRVTTCMVGSRGGIWVSRGKKACFVNYLTSLDLFF